MSKKTMITLHLSDSEMEVLNELSEKKDMNKSAVLRQALRMLAMIEKRIEQGEKIYLESLDKEKSEIIML